MPRSNNALTTSTLTQVNQLRALLNSINNGETVYISQKLYDGLMKNMDVYTADVNWRNKQLKKPIEDLEKAIAALPTDEQPEARDMLNKLKSASREGDIKLDLSKITKLTEYKDGIEVEFSQKIKQKNIKIRVKFNSQDHLHAKATNSIHALVALTVVYNLLTNPFTGGIANRISANTEKDIERSNTELIKAAIVLVSTIFFGAIIMAGTSHLPGLRAGVPVLVVNGTDSDSNLSEYRGILPADKYENRRRSNMPATPQEIEERRRNGFLGQLKELAGVARQKPTSQSTELNSILVVGEQQRAQTYNPSSPKRLTTQPSNEPNHSSDQGFSSPETSSMSSTSTLPESQPRTTSTQTDLPLKTLSQQLDHKRYQKKH